MARLVLEVRFGMEREDLAVQAARLPGFQHTGAKIRAAVEEVIAAEVRAGRLAEGPAGRIERR